MDEPIRVLTEEEVTKRTVIDSVAASEEGVDGETLELGRQIWKTAMAGANRDQISERLNLPVETLDKALDAYQLRLGSSDSRFRALDNDRLDRLIAFWLPKAVTKMKVLQVKGENVYVAEDFDRPLKAAYFVMQALSARSKVVGSQATSEAGAGGLEGGKQYSERNITIWLKAVMPAIEQISREVESEVVKS